MEQEAPSMVPRQLARISHRVIAVIAFRGDDLPSCGSTARLAALPRAAAPRRRPPKRDPVVILASVTVMTL
jgi:hypothetical protein